MTSASVLHRQSFIQYIYFFHQVLEPASSSLSLCFQEHQKKVSNVSEWGGFYSHSSLQHEKQVKPSYFRGIPKRIIHYLQRTSTAAMSQNIPSSEGVRTPTNLSKNHLLSGQIEAFPMHDLFHKHLLS